MERVAEIFFFCCQRVKGGSKRAKRAGDHNQQEQENKVVNPSAMLPDNLTLRSITLDNWKTKIHYLLRGELGEFIVLTNNLNVRYRSRKFSS
jgi:hypothetical protein